MAENQTFRYIYHPLLVKVLCCCVPTITMLDLSCTLTACFPQKHSVKYQFYGMLNIWIVLHGPCTLVPFLPHDVQCLRLGNIYTVAYNTYFTALFKQHTYYITYKEEWQCEADEGEVYETIPTV